MKVVMAQDIEGHVIGLLRNTEDEMVFMQDWLHNREPGQYRPHRFKVYNFEPGDYQPMSLGTMIYYVNYDGYEGKVAK